MKIKNIEEIRTVSYALHYTCPLCKKKGVSFSPCVPGDECYITRCEDGCGCEIHLFVVGNVLRAFKREDCPFGKKYLMEE